MIIGVSGTNSSGKDTVVKYLQNKGFFHVSLSDMIREEMKKRDVEINRDNLVKTGNLLEKELGAGALAKVVIQRYSNKDNLVISSVRKPPEVDYLHTFLNFKLIFVDAPLEERYNRALMRAREGEEGLSLEDFKSQDLLEMSGENTQRLDYCKKKADILIENNGSLKKLKQKVDEIIE